MDNIYCILFVAFLAAGCQCQQEITTFPTNTSVLLGQNASILCGVTGTAQGGDDLTWRKILADETTVFIGTNSNTNNATKHMVTEKYRLNIIETILSDEGTYRCTVFPDNYDAIISVNDAPSSASLSWPGDQSYTTAGVAANLTCTASSSRPPATFRWFKGNTEVTSQAVAATVTTDTNGYGQGVSMLEQTPVVLEVGTVYRCVADVPAKQSSAEASLTLSFSGAGHVAASLSMIGLALLASMMKI